MKFNSQSVSWGYMDGVSNDESVHPHYIVLRSYILPLVNMLSTLGHGFGDEKGDYHTGAVDLPKIANISFGL